MYIEIKQMKGKKKLNENLGSNKATQKTTSKQKWNEQKQKWMRMRGEK